MTAGSGRVKKPKLRLPLEKEVEDACDQLMAGLGYRAIKFSTRRSRELDPRHHTTQQTPGIADRRYYKRDAWPDGSGHAFWFECKRSPKAEQRESQRDFQQLVTECGEIYVLGDRDMLVRYLVDHAPIGRLQREALRVQFGIPAPAGK